MTEAFQRPQKGDRYIVVKPFVAVVATHWHAPFTGGAKQEIPAGLEFMIAHAPPEWAKGIWGRPEPYKEWEQKFVSEKDRTAENYDSCSISISFDVLKTCCSQIQ